MISRNVSITLWKLITDLSCSAKNLYSCQSIFSKNSLYFVRINRETWVESNYRANIIMHCLFSSKNNWDIKNYISKTIDKKTKRKVITVDARNHDDSPHTSNMSYEDMAMRRLAIIDMSSIRSPSSSPLLIKKIFEAMSSATADGSPTLSEALKIIDQQFEKSITSNIIRQFLIANLVEMDLGKYKWCQNLPVLVNLITLLKKQYIFI
ncbi:hypothetical protein ACFW04_009073 [Cataglyphis niger]